MIRTVILGSLAVVILFSGSVLSVSAQHSDDSPMEVAIVPGMSAGHQHGVAGTDGWEGSAEGIAYSERNHHIAGLMVILMGVAELSHAMRLSSVAWARFLLPSAMLVTGLFLAVWSDHEAWPIGSMSLIQTFWSQDPEIFQHKTYGLLALCVGLIELVRRVGRMGHGAWATPLPLMAIVGGVMLFGHSHGAHPAAHKIALHHTIMGTLAVMAGSTKLWSGWGAASKSGSSKWELLWAGLILVIGMQLLVYSE
jgi:putative copper resistance protein D